VVFVHPVGGDVLCYADLATELANPFYGLQVPDDAARLDTVPAMASHYVDAVVAQWPTGPVRLGGWSMGGVIALEMAGQLTARGREVELVTAIDLYEPPGGGLGRIVDDAELLARFARDLTGLSGKAWSLDPDLLRSTVDRSAIAVLRDEAVRAGVLGADIDLETLSRIAERFCRNLRALFVHDPKPYDGRVVLYRAQDGGATTETTQAWLARLTGDAQSVDVPGDHYTVMRGENLRNLARHLRLALTAVQI
jgi:thioesterase domain-containing protein